MGLFGSGRRDQGVRVFRGTCENREVVRAKLTIHFARPEPAEAAEALMDAAVQLAEELVGLTESPPALARQQHAIEEKLQAVVSARAPGASVALETFSPSAPPSEVPLPRDPPNRRGRVLVVDDEEATRVTIAALLSEEFDVELAADAARAEETVAAFQPDVVLADYELGGRSGLELLHGLRTTWPATIGMLITGHGDYPEVVAAMGDDRIFRVLLKPYDPEALVATVRTAVGIALMRR